VAQALDAELQVLTVRPTIPALGLWASHNLMLPPESPDERQHALVALRTFACQRTGRADVRVRIEDGAIVTEILRVADEWPAHLIALGTHGTSGVDGLALGSVTERVLRRSHIPVLVVPRFASDASPEPTRVLVSAVDRSMGATRALEHAAALARAVSARLVVVHVVDHVLDEAPQFTRHFDCEACYRAVEPQLRTWYAAAVSATAGEPAPELDLRFGAAAVTILAAAAEHHADLIVLGAAGGPSLFGSTARNVTRQSPVPVLVVPADAPFVKE
jgi:nucleotide-binding universal stress UspA family protein